MIGVEADSLKAYLSNQRNKEGQRKQDSIDGLANFLYANISSNAGVNLNRDDFKALSEALNIVNNIELMRVNAEIRTSVQSQTLQVANNTASSVEIAKLSNKSNILPKSPIKPKPSMDEIPTDKEAKPIGLKTYYESLVNASSKQGKPSLKMFNDEVDFQTKKATFSLPDKEFKKFLDQKISGKNSQDSFNQEEKKDLINMRKSMQDQKRKVDKFQPSDKKSSEVNRKRPDFINRILSRGIRNSPTTVRPETGMSH
jgi:hypothetical protein